MIFSADYPDGGSSDTAELQSFNPIPDAPHEHQTGQGEVDPCILNGVLQKNIGIAVALNGCPGSNNFVVRLKENFLLCTVNPSLSPEPEQVPSF